jgi:hypothetical protein
MKKASLNLQLQKHFVFSGHMMCHTTVRSTMDGIGTHRIAPALQMQQ